MQIGRLGRAQGADLELGVQESLLSCGWGTIQGGRLDSSGIDMIAICPEGFSFACQISLYPKSKRREGNPNARMVAEIETGNPNVVGIYGEHVKDAPLRVCGSCEFASICLKNAIENTRGDSTRRAKAG